MKKILKFIDSVIKFFTVGKMNYGVSGSFNIIERRHVPRENYDWSLIHAGIDRLSYKGEGQKVAILDTGVDKYHRDLDGSVELINLVNGSLDIDENSHGTFVAGEILARGQHGGIIGIAPMAKGVAIKVLYGDERDGKINNFEQTLSDGLMKSMENGCGVVSMSIGFNRNSLSVMNSLNEIVSNGIIPIAAFGNDGMSGSLYNSYPACYSNCIAVSSANEKDMPAWFSSESTKNVIEGKPEIAVASKEYYWGCLPNNSYGKMIGSSMACPVVAGVALLWRESMEKKGLLPKGDNVLKQFRLWLRKVSIDSNCNGWDESLGYGVLKVKNSDF